jgi:hypothetical protein
LTLFDHDFCIKSKKNIHLQESLIMNTVDIGQGGVLIDVVPPLAEPGLALQIQFDHIVERAVEWLELEILQHLVQRDHIVLYIPHYVHRLD